jgi:hypothetical protein
MKITTSTYDPSKSMTATVFLSEFEKLVEMYNEQQTEDECRLGGMMLKNLLQNAFSKVAYLRDVANREQEMAVRGFPMFTYETYKQLLSSAATIYDETKVSRTRSVNFVDSLDDTEEGTPVQEMSDHELFVNVLKGKTPGSTMNKETWNSIDKNDQAIWDKLGDGTKKKILQYAYDRAQKRVTNAKVNKTSISEEPTDDANDVPADQDNDIPEEEFQIMKTEITDAISKARKEAHPADIRRMLGKPNAQVKFTRIIEEDSDEESNTDDLDALIDQYWESEDEDFPRGD